MKIENVEFMRASGGWICRVGFMRPAHEQFSDVYQTVDGIGVGRLSLVKALLAALAQRRTWMDSLPVIQAARAKKGWA